ncbi:hypothetical protein CONPUDRAFT_165704 [Coniophora puteana RWD-64-598 SS2]|uniref:Uncharacterized protein n=1 Tax=Coniophora puteana (strain RWD-64-598) TaxID=741705 RepID=A0A5M3MS81_CONPW|nr:uncharacterized protein CONPUDRAFT_165704 [Coniophora puteana RWD-64-598 SS2]EIW81604.1 hypothetical protein CONPUDRAFT_165704 [Coniophora puteana RWD-64-598 SS2]
MIFSDARTHLTGPSRDVYLTRVTVPGSGGGALSKAPDGRRCVVAGRETVRILRVNGVDESLSEREHKSATGRGGYHIDASRNMWDNSGLRLEYASTDVAWAQGNFDKKILTSARSGDLVMWDLEKNGSNKYERRTRTHARAVHTVRCSPCVHYYALTGAADGDLRVWDLRDMQRSLMKIHHPSGVRSVVPSPSTSHPLQAVVGLDNGSIYRWDLQMGQRGQLDRLPVAHTGPVLSLDWTVSPTHTGLSTGNGAGTSSPQGTYSSATGVSTYGAGGRDSGTGGGTGGAGQGTGAGTGTGVGEGSVRSWILSGGMDRSVKIWSLTPPSTSAHISPRPIYTLHPAHPVRRARWRPGHPTEVLVVPFSGDERSGGAGSSALGTPAGSLNTIAGANLTSGGNAPGMGGTGLSRAASMGPAKGIGASGMARVSSMVDVGSALPASSRRADLGHGHGYGHGFGLGGRRNSASGVALAGSANAGGGDMGGMDEVGLGPTGIGGGEIVEVWDVRRPWLAKWAVEGCGVSDAVFATPYSLWMQHNSGTFAQVDMRNAIRPIDAISRVALAWGVVPPRPSHAGIDTGESIVRQWDGGAGHGREDSECGDSDDETDSDEDGDEDQDERDECDEGGGEALVWVSDRKKGVEVPYDDIHPDKRALVPKLKTLGDPCTAPLLQNMGAYVRSTSITCGIAGGNGQVNEESFTRLARAYVIDSPIKDEQKSIGRVQVCTINGEVAMRARNVRAAQAWFLLGSLLTDIVPRPPSPQSMLNEKDRGDTKKHVHMHQPIPLPHSISAPAALPTVGSLGEDDGAHGHMHQLEAMRSASRSGAPSAHANGRLPIPHGEPQRTREPSTRDGGQGAVPIARGTAAGNGNGVEQRPGPPPNSRSHTPASSASSSPMRGPVALPPSVTMAPLSSPSPPTSILSHSHANSHSHTKPSDHNNHSSTPRVQIPNQPSGLNRPSALGQRRSSVLVPSVMSASLNTRRPSVYSRTSAASTMSTPSVLSEQSHAGTGSSGHESATPSVGEVSRPNSVSVGGSTSNRHYGEGALDDSDSSDEGKNEDEHHEGDLHKEDDVINAHTVPDDHHSHSHHPQETSSPISPSPNTTPNASHVNSRRHTKVHTSPPLRAVSRPSLAHPSPLSRLALQHGWTDDDTDDADEEDESEDSLSGPMIPTPMIRLSDPGPPLNAGLSMSARRTASTSVTSATSGGIPGSMARPGIAGPGPAGGAGIRAVRKRPREESASTPSVSEDSSEDDEEHIRQEDDESDLSDTSTSAVKSSGAKIVPPRSTGRRGSMTDSRSRSGTIRGPPPSVVTSVSRSQIQIPGLEREQDDISGAIGPSIEHSRFDSGQGTVTPASIGMGRPSILSRQESKSSVRTVTRGDASSSAEPDWDPMLYPYAFAHPSPYTTADNSRAPSPGGGSGHGNSTGRRTPAHRRTRSRVFDEQGTGGDRASNLNELDREREEKARERMPETVKRMTVKQWDVVRAEEAKFREAGWTALKEAFEELVVLGDIQTCAMLAVVASDELKLGKRRKMQLLESYIDILSRMRLHTVAAYLRKFTDIDEVRNVTKLETVLYTICGTCRKPVLVPASRIRSQPKGAYSLCPSCKASFRCSVCHLPVRTLLFHCSICGHGGHQECYRRYCVYRPMTELSSSFSSTEVRGRQSGRERMDSFVAEPEEIESRASPSGSHAGVVFPSPGPGHTVPPSGSPKRKKLMLGHPCAAGCGHFCLAAVKTEEVEPWR